MPFKFRHLCDLLQALDDNRIKKKATGARAKNSDTAIIISWFNKHSREIPRHGTDAVAFLSSLLPERRADRVYNTQAKRLEKIVGRTLLLSTTRLRQLASWRLPQGADFAQTVQIVMSDAEFDRPRPEFEVTLEEIDVLFDRVAATYSGSSPDLRARVTDPIAADKALPSLFRRLQSVEAKWLVRMFLKQYTPVELPEMLIMRQFHCLLPDILRLQNCFTAAMRCLDNPTVSSLSPRPRDKKHEQAIKLQAASHLRPEVGVMIQRAPYWKARSMQHCCDMAGRRRMSIERKYDGEYCQVHVDLSKGKHSIKLFSKSGKDSTDDRIRLHGAITDALKLGKVDCPIKEQGILEGELLIWNHKEQKIQPFDKIRKHVSRNGRFLGNDQDSPRDYNERLMIIFYDLLLYDDIVCLNEPLDRRRSLLCSLVHCVPGQADVGSRETLHFGSSEAKSMIRRAFAICISRGWEGFVLKGCDDPYFSLADSPPCFKLKKDYITGLGDMADLAIIGGRRYATDEQVLNIGKLHWTTFYLGCLENHDDVSRFAATPTFRVVGVVSAATQTISLDRVRYLNQRGQFESVPYASKGEEMEVIMDQSLDSPTEIFKNPFVVEVVGGGFIKPANVTYYTLRFPRITRIHEDRSCTEIMSFDGLQRQAKEAQSMAANEDSQQDRGWIEYLIQTDPTSKFVAENSASTPAGRRLNSATTVSSASNSHGQPTSPLLVRIDTQDMTEQEYDDKALNVSSSTLTPTQTRSSTRKRKFHDHSSHSVTLTKPLKVSGRYAAAAADTSGSSRQRPDMPSCTQLRKPLRQIQNPMVAVRRPSIEIQAPSQPQEDESGHHSVSDRPPSDAKKSIFLAATLHENVVSGQTISEHPPKRLRREMPLPTPPTSSAEEFQGGSCGNVQRERTSTIQSEKRKESRDNSVREIVRSSPALDTAISTKPVHLNLLQRCSSMIFLSPAIGTTADYHSQEFLSSFAHLEISFTLSRKLLLDNLQSTHRTWHLAIVNIANPKDAGNEVGTFHRAILKRFRKKQSSKGRLIFLDRTVLPHLGTKELSACKLKPYFGGCLLWNCIVDVAGQQSLEVRDVWRWERVLEELRMQGN